MIQLSCIWLRNYGRGEEKKQLQSIPEEDNDSYMERDENVENGTSD
jgi:hypothetical protein